MMPMSKIAKYAIKNIGKKLAPNKRNTAKPTKWKSVSRKDRAIKNIGKRYVHSILNTVKPIGNKLTHGKDNTTLAIIAFANLRSAKIGRISIILIIQFPFLVLTLPRAMMPVM